MTARRPPLGATRQAASASAEPMANACATQQALAFAMKALRPLGGDFCGAACCACDGVRDWSGVATCLLSDWASSPATKSSMDCAGTARSPAMFLSTCSYARGRELVVDHDAVKRLVWFGCDA